MVVPSTADLAVAPVLANEWEQLASPLAAATTGSFARVRYWSDMFARRRSHTRWSAAAHCPTLQTFSFRYDVWLRGVGLDGKQLEWIDFLAVLENFKFKIVARYLA
jgi:hypothetical protein